MPPVQMSEVLYCGFRWRLCRIAACLLAVVFVLITVAYLARCRASLVSYQQLFLHAQDPFDCSCTPETAQHSPEPWITRPKSPGCLVLRDFSDDDVVPPETEERRKNATTSRQCADDADVLDVIEKCYGVRPVLWSTRFVDRSNLSPECFVVPNVVHYVLLRDDDKNVARKYLERTFLHYLSFVSVDQHIRPSYILIHGDALPTGDWWRRTVTEVPNIYFVNTTAPTQIYDKPLQQMAHRSDILRYRIVYELGGIYFDPDVLVFRSLDPLRRLPLTLPRESAEGVGNSIIVSRPGQAFFRIWLETYRTFHPREWAQHSVMTTAKLLKLLPGMAHIEKGTMLYPHWTQLDRLFGTVLYDWTAQYTCHVWKRLGKVPESPEEIRTLNSTLGQMMRYIYNAQRLKNPT